METKAIKQQVYANFQSGFHCAEALSKAILETFSDKPHPDVVKASSSFGGGIAGTTEELCGAFTGGVLALGTLLGREKGGDDLRDCGTLTKEFKKRFQQEFGSLNCGTLLEGFGDTQKPLECSKLTANAAAILASLLEEQGLGQQQALNPCCRPREKVALGTCPFTAGC